MAYNSNEVLPLASRRKDWQTSMPAVCIKVTPCRATVSVESDRDTILSIHVRHLMGRKANHLKYIEDSSNKQSEHRLALEVERWMNELVPPVEFQEGTWIWCDCWMSKSNFEWRLRPISSSAGDTPVVEWGVSAGTGTETLKCDLMLCLWQTCKTLA